MNFSINSIDVCVSSSYEITFTKKVKGSLNPLKLVISKYGNSGDATLQQEVEGRRFQKRLHRQLSGRHIPETYKSMKVKGEEYSKEKTIEKEAKIRKMHQDWMSNPILWICTEWFERSARWGSVIEDYRNYLPLEQGKVINVEGKSEGVCGISWKVRDTWEEVISRLNGLELKIENEPLVAKIVEIETYRQSQTNPYKVVQFSMA